MSARYTSLPLALATALALASVAHAGPSFEILWEGGGYVRALTHDGSMGAGGVAIGSSRQAALWRDGVLTPLGVPPGFEESWAMGLSADGSVVVGTAGREQQDGTLRHGAFVWENGVATALGPLLGPDDSAAGGVSDDGSVIIAVVPKPGRGPSFPGPSVFWHAFRIKGLEKARRLPLDTADAISADGRVIAGSADFDVVRFERGDVEPLEVEAFGELVTFGGWVAGLSADGSVVAGTAWSVPGQHVIAFRSRGGVTSLLSPLPGNDISNARGISGDGSLVVGESGNATDGGDEGWRATLWDETGTPRAIDELLVELGLDLTERYTRGTWQLDLATAISADGLVIAGNANLFGLDALYLARLGDPPLPVEIRLLPRWRSPHTRPGLVRVALLGSPAFDVRSVAASSLRFGPGGAAPVEGPSGRWRTLVGKLNADRHPDLVVQFRASETALASRSDPACLTGSTRDGVTLRGCTALERRRGP